jgi:chromosome segregation ATPase
LRYTDLTVIGYETISLQTTLLSNLPLQITELNTALSQLRATTQQPSPSHPSHNLPLPATQSLFSERQAELDKLNSQLKILQQALPKKSRELERAESEAKGLEEQRERVLCQARDAMRRRDEGSGADELEMRGRWLRGVENGLRGMLGVEA